MWLEETYCSNVESLCCIVDKQSTQRSNFSVGIYEKEIEQKNIIIKDYEAQIMKLKSLLNVKEQEMKKLVQNLCRMWYGLLLCMMLEKSIFPTAY